MLALKEFRSKNVGVYGLGITGLSIEKLLNLMELMFISGMIILSSESSLKKKILF